MRCNKHVRPRRSPYPWKAPRFSSCRALLYVQAVCWIGACLADALQYAHGRGLVHLDIKPSNVLLAGDGQPMLLDFHLAHEVVLPDRVTCDRLGGTPGYMSPEQEQAMAAIRQRRPVPAAVDGRSDIYSLGLLLYELLGGPPLVAPCSFQAPSPQEFDASIPPRVVGLIRKCLAREPEKRYADAGSLALDLRRCLIELPSRAPTKRTLADGPGLRGKLLNRPAAVVVLVLAVAMFAVAAINFVGRGDQGKAGQVADRDKPAGQSLLQRQQTADELHTLVDRLRFLDGLESLPVDRLRKLEAGCSEVWRGRSRLTNQATAPLAPEIERRVRTDLLELAILWADLHVRLAPAEQLDQARREALQVLAQAEAELGSSVVLSQGAADLRRGIGTERRGPSSVRQGRAAGAAHRLGALRRRPVSVASRETGGGRSPVPTRGRPGAASILAQLLRRHLCLPAAAVRSRLGGVLGVRRVGAGQGRVLLQPRPGLPSVGPRGSGRPRFRVRSASRFLRSTLIARLPTERREPIKPCRKTGPSCFTPGYLVQPLP